MRRRLPTRQRTTLIWLDTQRFGADQQLPSVTTWSDHRKVWLQDRFGRRQRDTQGVGNVRAAGTARDLWDAPIQNFGQECPRVAQRGTSLIPLVQMREHRLGIHLCLLRRHQRVRRQGRRGDHDADRLNLAEPVLVRVAVGFDRRAH